MLAAGIAELRYNKRRLVATLTAVAIGIAFLTGSLVLADSTRNALDESFTRVYAGADFVVRASEFGGSGGLLNPAGENLPFAVVGDIEKVAGVAAAAGRISAAAQIAPPARLGDRSPESGIALSLPADPQRWSIELRDGAFPTGSDEVTIDVATAETHRLETGELIDVLLPSGSHTLRITGTAGFGPIDGLTGGARVILNGAVAPSMLKADGYSDILVATTAEADEARVHTELATLLRGRAAVLSADEAAAIDAAAAAQQTAIFSNVLFGVAGVALAVSSILIANTFRMLVAQRTRQLALTRAIGASRRQVAVSVLVETAATGVAGGVVGVVVGGLLGWILVSFSGELLPRVPSSSVRLQPMAFVTAVAVGAAVALVAGLGSARRAMRIPPVAALREASVEDASIPKTRIAGGLVLTIVGAVILSVGLQNAAAILLLAVGPVLVIVGTGMLFPLVSRIVLALAGRVIPGTVTAGLAVQQARSAPRRTGSTIAALAVPLAVVTFLISIGASLEAASPAVAAQQQRADFLVHIDARRGLHDQLIPLVEELQSLQEIEIATVVTYADAVMGASQATETDVSVYSLDLAVAGMLFDVEATAGELGTENALAVRDRVAAERGWAVGDSVTLDTPDGTQISMPVGAVFTGSITTDWLVPSSIMEPHVVEPDRAAFATAAPGVDQAVARAAIDRVLAGFSAVQVLDREALAAEIRAANSSTIGILTALFALTILAGVLAVTNSMQLAVVDRVREFGLLRAIGATQGQVRAIVAWEAAIVAVMGAVVGVGLGLATAWLATRASSSTFPLPFAMPVVPVVVAVLITTALGVLAVVPPANRAAKTDVLDAIAVQ